MLSRCFAGSHWLRMHAGEPAGPHILMLIDWGYAHAADGPSPWIYHGTLLSMSQRTLAACILASSDLTEEERTFFETQIDERLYSTHDELESAVKSVLLLLSPVLKRSLKQTMAATSRTLGYRSSNQTKIKLWKCWDNLFGHHHDLRECLANGDYTGLASWIKSTGRLHFLSKDIGVRAVQAEAQASA